MLLCEIASDIWSPLTHFYFLKCSLLRSSSWDYF